MLESLLWWHWVLIVGGVLLTGFLLFIFGPVSGYIGSKLEKPYAPHAPENRRSLCETPGCSDPHAYIGARFCEAHKAAP